MMHREMSGYGAHGNLLYSVQWRALMLLKIELRHGGRMGARAAIEIDAREERRHSASYTQAYFLTPIF